MNEQNRCLEVRYGKKRNLRTSEIEASFLMEIAHMRRILTWNIATRNPGISHEERNILVRKIINCIITLRICEDRGIEQYGALRALLKGKNVSKGLCTLLQQVKTKYNLNLYYSRERTDLDELLDLHMFDLKLDDKILKKIIRRLYYPEGVLEFSIIPLGFSVTSLKIFSE